MSAALLLITHEHIADTLLGTAQDIVSDKFGNTAIVEVPMDTPTEEISSEIETRLTELDTEAGLLVLTDLTGSTPYNVALSVREKHGNTRLVSGINLPMLLKLFNYRHLPLDELTEKALAGGRTGIDTHR